MAGGKMRHFCQESQINRFIQMIVDVFNDYIDSSLIFFSGRLFRLHTLSFYFETKIQDVTYPLFSDLAILKKRYDIFISGNDLKKQKTTRGS